MSHFADGMRPSRHPAFSFYFTEYFVGPVGVSMVLYRVCSHSAIPGSIPTWVVYTICCFNLEMTVTDGLLLVDCQHARAWCCEPLWISVPLS